MPRTNRASSLAPRPPRLSPPRAAVLLLVVWVGVNLAVASPRAAPERAPRGLDPPFADPGAMFDLFFGEPTEEQEKRLAEIDVSAKQERRIGQEAVQAYLDYLERQSIRVVSRGKEVAYLQDLVKTIRPLMRDGKRYPAIKVYLAKSKRCEARSFPGGTLIFFRGLLDSAENEAALISIVGHELSHLDRGHQLRRVRSVKLAERTFADNDQEWNPRRFFTAGSAMLRIWTRPFRPEDETQADHDGATWAYRAGYDAREMARLFLRLHRRPDKDRTPLPAFFRSHPGLLDRFKATMKLYKELSKADPKDDLYLGQENLRRRVARARRVFEE